MRIRLGNVPLTIPNPTRESPVCTASRDELLLKINGVAKYHIAAGREVTIQPEDASSELDVRGYLLGNIFAILCHQRRLLPLHASAVRVGDGAVAFLGDSGAGKSTLAAFLVKRGHRLVADDVCLLDPDADAPHRVIPVAPWLKLWPTSLEALGREQDGLVRTFHDEDKYKLPIDAGARVSEERLPLRALVFLRRADAPDAPILLQQLSAAGTMVEAMRFTYQQYLLDWLGLQEEHFMRCGLAIDATPAFVCYRPWGFDGLQSLAEKLEGHFGR